MMRFVAVATAAFLLCAGGGAAHEVDIGSQLKGLDVPEGLQQFLGVMVAKMQGLQEDNVKLQKQQNRTRQENIMVRAKLEQVTKDKEALENKTNIMEVELRKENAALSIRIMELESRTKKDIHRIHARLDQCEADSFAQVVERRQTQELQTPACGREAVDSMLSVCCGSGVAAGNGHRLQESVGCDSLPSTCSLQCSYQFISIFDNCHDQTLMQGLSAEQLADWTSFYAVCSEVEQSAAEMGALQPVNVRMFRIMISSDAAQSQAEMFGNGGQTQPIIGPLPELPPSPPASSSDSESGSLEVQEYHAQCTTANILTCVPECNATHHGFELLATIDGTDTKFSCNLANQLFSWVGAAALGGFLGQNVAAFVSAVISGAAGTYVLTLTEDADVGTDLVVQPGQNVIISGDAGLEEPPSWGTGGFTVGESGSLALSNLRLATPISVAAGGSVALASVAFHLPLDSPPPLMIADGGEVSAMSEVSYRWGDRVWTMTTEDFDAIVAAGTPLDADHYPCFTGNYLTVPDDPGLRTSAAGGYRCDASGHGGPFGLGESGTAWYRLPAAHSLPTTPPGYYQCGTGRSGWLSGWSGSGQPDSSYATTADGSLPPKVSAPAAVGTVCFNDDHGRPCEDHTLVRAVSCGTFVLWELPPAPNDCSLGYCLV